MPLGPGRPGAKTRLAAGQSEPLAPRDPAGLSSPVVEQAVLRGVESGTTVRTDATPVAAPLRAPTDSALLGDAMRVLERLLRRAQPLCTMALPNHDRRVRRRTTALRQPKRDDEECVLPFVGLMAYGVQRPQHIGLVDAVPLSDRIAVAKGRATLMETFAAVLHLNVIIAT